MKKALVILSLAFLLLSCNNNGMATTEETTKTTETSESTNPFIGVWMADFPDGSDATITVVSHIQFIDNDFYYYVIRIDSTKDKELSRVTYKGKYNYNAISSVIFFEIEEPESEAGITSSSYRLHEDKLYCYGNKIFITEKLHSKVDISQYTQN